MSHHEVGDNLPFFQSPVVKPAIDPAYRAVSSSDENESHKPEPQSETVGIPDHGDQSLHDHPQFRRHAEATNAELFYDLFFIANLTVFTRVHEVNDPHTLAQYVGFFSILWFTWYLVSLYDVRFSTDSAFERICKACQFGVMIGFAVVGPEFNPGKKEESFFGYFQALTLMIMVSHIVLVFQYLQALWFTRHYKRTQLPMSLIAITHFLGAIIFMSLYFAFAKSLPTAYAAWYVVGLAEIIIVTAISSIWRHLGFKGTHLVQRMSLLTLIILGEGVMGLAQKCQFIGSSDIFGFDASTVGNIICSVLLLYFVYMLYFDWVQEQHFGTIREQIWAFLHFPLHLALVLAVEGAAQTILWTAATTVETNYQNYFYPLIENQTSPIDWAAVADTINTTYAAVLAEASWVTQLPNSSATWGNIYNFVANNATNIIAAGDKNTHLSDIALSFVWETTAIAVYDIAKFTGPENSTEGVLGPETDFLSKEVILGISNNFDSINRTFDLTFKYLFVSIGLVVILTTAMAALSKRVKRSVHYIRLAASGLIGLGLSLLAIMPLTQDTSDAYGNFAQSAWMLPTVVLALFLVVLLNSIRFPRAHLPLRGLPMPTLVPMRSRSTAADVVA